MKPPRSGLRRGDVLELVVEKPVYRGLGLCRHEGQVVFVPRTVPGDRVRARVEQSSHGFLRARVEEILSEGPGRRSAPCAHAAACGGCVYQGVDYDRQIELKRDVVLEALARARVRWTGGLDVVPSPEQGWRTRAALHFAEDGGRLRLGVREEGSHEVVDVQRCLQLSDAAMTAAERVRAWLDGDPGRKARRAAGRLGDLELAEGKGGLVVALGVEGSAAAVQPLAALAAEVPGLTGFGLLVPRGGGHRYVHVSGSPFLAADVLGERLRWHVMSFFQSNRFLVEPLAAHVVSLVPREGRVLDLYAGAGLFALPLARRGSDVVAVEGHPLAAADARANALAAALPVRVVEADVRDVAASLDRVADETIVLDPPRAGAGRGVVEAVMGRAPAAIVYVSCDPATLARDLAVLAAGGYRVDALRAFDMFPDTFHVETVARVVRAL